MSDELVSQGDGIMFRGHSHTVVGTGGSSYLSLNQLCSYMGMDSEGQRQSLERKSWSKGRTCVLQVQLEGDRQARQHYLIDERIVPMWIANISTRHIRDDVVRRTVEQYQAEFADALYEYVATGRVEPATLVPQGAPGWAVALYALVDQQVAIEVEQRRQADQLREMSAKMVAIEGAHDEFTALAYAKLNDLPTSRPYLARVGSAATRLMKQQGAKPHRRQDATFGTVNVYPMPILEEAFAATPAYGEAS
jgi:hypothetical protein